MTRSIEPAYKAYTRKLPLSSKLTAEYINLHESEGSLAPIKFAQDTITNWVPKVVFTRSLADFADMSFLELTENLIVYGGPALLGQGIFRKIYSKGLNPTLKKKITDSTLDLIENKTANNKPVLAVKAALAVSALGIPLAEYSLNYVKNILTLKMFKQGDFNNIANLNKVKTENTTQQEKLKDSAKKHIKIAAGIFAGCLGFAALLATKGRTSQKLQSVCEFILAPGSKIFKKNAEKAGTVNKFFGLDFGVKTVVDKFGNEKKKLTMSKGQLMACVLVGFLGYIGAAKDRGKQNILEVVFRYPIVTSYLLVGQELLEKGYKNILREKKECKEIFDIEEENIYKNKIKMQNKEKDLIKHEMPTLSELPEIAKGLALKNGTTQQYEFEKLFKQKAKLIGVPTIFGLIVMGFFVAGYSRFFTQYRYNKEKSQIINK